MSALAPVDDPKFTPGPWQFIPRDETPGYREPAMVQIDNAMWLSQGDRNGEANAKLIAAAPDLYTALARLLSLCEAGADPFEEPNRAVVNQALAALLKANPHLPSGAASCSADSPAGSISSPIPSGTNPQSDSDAISEVKGKARPENAAGVESPLSEPIIVMTHEGIRT